METIKTYIDNVFAAYPQTSEVQALKRDMLANMEEKYVKLRQGGKSEHEATYSVIADFGNIEELNAELGLGTKSGEMDDSISLSWDEAQAYLATSKSAGVWIGLGVWLILTGVAALIFLGNIFPLFLAVAIAVIMFIVNGSRLGAYDSFEETPIRLDSNTREMAEIARAAFMPRCTAMIAVGVALIILAVGAVAAIGLPVPLLLFVIGFSVFLFVVAGFYSSAFDVLLGKGDYSNKRALKKSGKIIGTIAAVYWPVVTAIALWQLFCWEYVFLGDLAGGRCFVWRNLWRNSRLVWGEEGVANENC